VRNRFFAGSPPQDWAVEQLGGFGAPCLSAGSAILGPSHGDMVRAGWVSRAPRLPGFRKASPLATVGSPRLGAANNANPAVGRPHAETEGKPGVGGSFLRNPFWLPWNFSTGRASLSFAIRAR